MKSINKLSLDRASYRIMAKNSCVHHAREHRKLNFLKPGEKNKFLEALTTAVSRIFLPVTWYFALFPNDLHGFDLNLLRGNLHI